jgi:arylsulfatase A-like enzyme
VTLLSGRDPLQHGTVRNGDELQADVPLLAESFRAAGYATAAFVSSFVLDARFGWDRGFDDYDGEFSEQEATLPKERGNPGVFFLKHDFGGFDRRADATVDSAIAWLATAPEPYFLFVHLFDPHDPYVPPEAYEDALAGVRFDTRGRSAPDARKPARMRRLIRRYHAEVRFTDDQLARLLAAVERRSGRRRITLVTADHGEGLGQHDWLFHAMNLYDEALHVPLIVDDTAARAEGARIQTPVALADVAPTLLDLAGLPPLADTEGRSLADSVRRGEEPPARPLFAHRRAYPANAPGSRGERLAVREHAWKLIRNLGESEELYDLGVDPGELQSRVGEAERSDPERLAALRSLLDAYAAGRRATGPAPVLDDDVRAALEALGYTE